MSRYDAYEPFADLYNRRFGGFAQRLPPVLDRLGLVQLAPGSHVLDLCCGTGQLAAELCHRGFEVTGVDGSAAMVTHARRNAPEARCLVADARSFELDRPVDAVVSTYDSLNHIMTLDELTQVFRRVASALVDGGLFIFDLNMEEGFMTRWQGAFCIVEDDESIVARSSYEADDGLARLDLTIFTLIHGDLDVDGTWRRFDLTFTQRRYHPEQLRQALTGSGFGDIRFTDAVDLGLADVGRSFVTARTGVR